MKNSFENSLLETGEGIKKGYSLLLHNAGKAIALFTGLVAVLTTFTEIGFLEFDLRHLTSSAIIMLVSSYLIFFSLVDAGEKLGKESKEYRAAKTVYLEKREKILGEDMPALRDFCERYSDEEIKFRRQTLLKASGYSYSEYESYKSGTDPSKEAKRVFKKVDRMKPIRLTPGELLNGGKLRGQDEFKNPERWRTAKLIVKLIPSSLCMLFTLNIMLKAKDGLGFAEVAEGLLKLSALPVIALKGYSCGYTYARSDAVFWLETKSRLLEAFISAKTKCN